MDQRVKKAKLFHVLKIAFYCLGFPIFFLAVFGLAMQNYGHTPFMGPASGEFIAIKSLASSPAMYAIWIALAVWIAAAAVQVICNYFIKNRSARATMVMAIILVILLLPVFIIDGVYTAKLEQIAENAPEGVEVKDYKTQLSYYRTQTSATNNNGSTMKVSYTDTLKAELLEFCTVYNLPYNGLMFQSNAGSFENEGLRYDDFNYDYNADGVVDEYDHILIKNDVFSKPYGTFEADSLTLTNFKGENPVVVKGNFFCVKYVQQVSPDSKEDVACCVWYDGNKRTPVETDGYYGTAYYNKNGMLADGYVFSVEVALNILEEYYQAQEDMKALFAKTGYTGTEAQLRAEIEAAAMARLEERYTGANATEEEKFLWNREKAQAEGHSLTVAELNSALAELGGVIGEAKLIEGLLPTVQSFLGGSLSMPLGDLLDMVLGGSMPATLNFIKANLSEYTAINVAISYTDHLQLALSNIPNVSGNVVIDVDETLSTATVKELLDTFGISNDLLVEVISLIGFSANATDNSLESLEGILSKFLETLYWYRSPIIEPEYNFYVDETLSDESPKGKALKEYQAAYARYKRAEYEGSFHGALVGSKIIGMGVGLGTDMLATGHITTLQQVQQLKADLSYKPEMYNVLLARDMLVMFAGIIVFFTFMSYWAADRALLWETGQIEPKKSKKAVAEEELDTVNHDETVEEDTVEQVEENTEEVA